MIQPSLLNNSAGSLSVIIPVYNSEEILPELVRRLRPVLESLTADFELILVNDGSHDSSWETVCQLTAHHEWIRGINLMRNFGQHNALLCGIRAARYEVTVTMDDDLQHPPEELPKLINKLAEGYDVVYGTPDQEQHGFLRNTASRITKLALQTAMGAETARNVSAFRVFRTILRKSFSNFRGPFVSIDVLLTWGTRNFAHIPVNSVPRLMGASNYNFLKLITHAFNMMTGFSAVPLQFASILGFMFTVFGLGVLCYVLVNYLFRGGAVPGFAFLASSIAIFSGAQLFSLGIIGEYLARMHFRMMDRPVYTVRHDTAEPMIKLGKKIDEVHR
jgi:undecaprenyl-phosphate 4-deoxy-4-formamido-L-arabinose transferase